MTRILITLLVVMAFSYQSQAQSLILQGKVVDAKTQEPLLFANIIVNDGERGTSTDIDGKFFLELKSAGLRKITFSYVGYNAFEYLINRPEDLNPLRQSITIKLEEQASDLDEVIINAGANPAHRIIRAATRNRRRNDPEKIKTFRYKSYNKFYVDLSDASKTLSDSVIAQSVDSNFVKVLGHLESHHFFVSEAVTERKFRAPNYDKEEVLANRVSGIKDPGFTTLATDFQPFSFYRDFVEILRSQYRNPISPGSIDKYFFSIEDTTFQDTDTVYIISFQPFPDKNFEALRGILYINTNGFALQNVVASPADTTGVFNFKIQQKYDFIDREHWFPTQLMADVYFNNFLIGGKKVMGVNRTYLREIKLYPELRKKDFDEINLEINPLASRRSDEYWDYQRIEALGKKEKNTYQFMDSVGQQIRINEVLKVSEAFTYGRYPIGKFDLDLTSLVKVNRFEGLRLGLGFFTNHRLSSRWSGGAYVAYGTRDGRFKYGLSTQVNLEKRYDLKLGLSYRDDVLEPGNPDYWLEKNLFSQRFIRYFLTQRMDRIRNFDLMTSLRPFRDAQFRLNLRVREQSPLYDYTLRIPREDAVLDSIRDFRSSELRFSFRYAFRQKYIKIRNRRVFLESAYPIVSINYILGQDIFGSSLNYQKLEGTFDYELQIRSLGKSRISLQFGWVNEILPYTLLYNGAGLVRQLPIAAEGSFQTMELYEFLSDRFVNLFYRHNFGRLLFRGKSKIFQPEFILAQSFAWGKLRNPSFHEGITFQSLERGYHESGILINNLLKFKYFNFAHYGLGFGAFFRYGPYARDDFWENVSLKLTFQFSLN